MKKDQEISEVLRQLRVPASSKLDERIYEELGNAGGAGVSPVPEPTFGQIIGLLLKMKSTRYTLATTLGLALLVVLVLNHSTTSAWAMDQAVEALKKYKGLHMTGYYKTTNNQTMPLDAWARSDPTGNRVAIGFATAGDFTIWTRDDKTYGYDQTQKKGFVQPGINFMDTWLGAKLLASVARMNDYKAIEGDDPATGQKRVIVTCSLENFAGAQSFLMEFDARTKLLVSAKTWKNLTRAGTPQWSFDKVLYFEDLPDSSFDFEPPAGTQFADVPPEVPDDNLPLLSDPKCGISADGMTQEQACQRILEELWTAIIKKDKDRIRELLPLARTWSDEMLRGSDDPNEIPAQVLKIGGIERTGSSKLGTLALVPSWIRYQDGSVREEWVLVQFRETDQGTSCVVQGPHGYGLNVKE